MNSPTFTMSRTKIPKIAIEEAFTLPELAHKSSAYTGPNGGRDLPVDLLDIHDRRLERMDASGVSFMVLSLTSPGPQDEASPEKAHALAQKANDYLAKEIEKNPSRFAGFASLSMHNPTTAATEARRAIKELGMIGIIVNDFQTVSEDGEQVVFYDQPEWDVFWQEIVDLDVPVYFHPRLTTPNVLQKFLSGRPSLRGSPYFFAVGKHDSSSSKVALQVTYQILGVSLHVLGLYVNGVFERFPQLQVIIGHMGEHLLLQLWRIDHRLSYYAGAAKPKTDKTFRHAMKNVSRELDYQHVVAISDLLNSRTFILPRAATMARLHCCMPFRKLA